MNALRAVRKRHGYQFIQGSIRRYEKVHDEKGLFQNTTPLTKLVFRGAVFCVEVLFAGFAWAVYIVKLVNFEGDEK